MEDLYQIGCIGFIKSIKRFDTNFEVKLSTYSVPYMIGEIKRFIRDDGAVKVSRSLKELNIKIRETQRYHLSKEGRELTIDELSKELKVSKEDINLALEAITPVESIDKKVSTNKDEKDLSIIDRISTGEDEAEKLVNKIVVKELISKLETKEKEIIMLRFYKEKTQSEVAKILGINQVQVSRMERKILQSMRVKLKGAS